MKPSPFLSLALASTLFLTACQKDAADSKDSNVTYQLAVQDGSPGLANEGGRAQASYLDFTGGSASVKEIKFEAKGDNKIEYKSNVPQTINLANALTTLGGIAVPYGTYNKIEFKIKFEPLQGQPALTLQGNYTPTAGGTAIPVVLQFAGPFELKFEKKTPTTIDAQTDYSALGTLALNQLIAAVPESLLANATQTNGQIVISSTSNPNLYAPLWSLFEGLLKVEIKKK